VRGKAIAIAVAGAWLAGCAGQRDTAVFVDGDRLHTGTGSTVGSGGGSASNASTAPAAPTAPKEPRANTPPGTTRDGAGPAAGAIVDPTGAATEKKP
jgi:hypothetical protein